MEEDYTTKEFLHIVANDLLIPFGELMTEETLIVAVVINIVAEFLILGLVFVEELFTESLNIKCLYDVIPVYIPMLVN